MEVGEINTLPGQLVDVGSLDRFMPMATKLMVTLVIGQNQDHVGSGNGR